MTPPAPARANPARLTPEDRATIVQLLERYDDLVDPMQTRAGADPSFGAALMPDTYRHSAKELERLLRLMRDGRGSIVKWEVEGRRYAASPRKLWWHLNARYIAAVYVQRKERVTRKTKRGKITEPVWRMVRLPNGSMDVYVERGVDWLCAEWTGARPVLPRAELDKPPDATVVLDSGGESATLPPVALSVRPKTGRDVGYKLDLVTRWDAA